MSRRINFELFRCLTAGGHDSGWQASSSYTDTGLSASTEYTYRVKARDLSAALNETAYSSNASATTLEAPGGDPAGSSDRPFRESEQQRPCVELGRQH